MIKLKNLLVEMPTYSVAAVEKSLRSLARKYEADGFETNIDTFKSGKGGNTTGESYVTLELTKKMPDGDDFWYEGKFICNGYSTFGKHEYGTEKGLNAAKQKFNDEVQRQLKYYTK